MNYAVVVEVCDGGEGSTYEVRGVGLVVAAFSADAIE